MKKPFFKDKIFWLSIFIAASLSACISTRIANAISGHYYKYTFAVREHTTRKPTATFADNILSINFDPQYIRVNYSVTNVSGGPISIDWNKAYLVVQNDSSKIIPSTINILDADQTPQPSQIQSGQSLQGFFTPIDYIKRNDSDRWVATEFYPGHDQSNSENTDWIMGLLGVNIFKLYLPVVISNSTKTYRFTFYPVEMEKSAVSLDPKQ